MLFTEAAWFENASILSLEEGCFALTVDDNCLEEPEIMAALVLATTCWCAAY